MAITNKQYQSLQSEACRMAEELPNSLLHACLTALYEAGRLLHLTRPTLIGFLGSVALRCVLDEALPAAPAPGTRPRLIQRAGYNEGGNLVLVQGAWLLKELYVERRFGRRKKGVLRRKRPDRHLLEVGVPPGSTPTSRKSRGLLEFGLLPLVGDRLYRCSRAGDLPLPL